MIYIGTIHAQTHDSAHTFLLSALLLSSLGAPLGSMRFKGCKHLIDLFERNPEMGGGTCERDKMSAKPTATMNHGTAAGLMNVFK